MTNPRRAALLHELPDDDCVHCQCIHHCSYFTDASEPERNEGYLRLDFQDLAALAIFELRMLGHSELDSCQHTFPGLWTAVAEVC